MQSFLITKNQAGQRFDKFLHKYLPGAGSSFLYKMLRKKNITLNGKRAQGNEILSTGDLVESFFSEETFLLFSGGKNTPSNSVLQDQRSPGKCSVRSAEYRKAYQTLAGVEILYEDENILALNKPAGVLTQKAQNSDFSLNEWLIGYLLTRGELTEEDLKTFLPSVCNRLDFNTSGIVLCGKSLVGLQFLSELLRDRKLGKYYKTICAGKICEETILSGYLKKDHEKNTVLIQRKADKAEENEKKQKNSAVFTKVTPVCNNGRNSFLEVRLFTGKTHQIRAHLASIGHPVIGDGKYGTKEINLYFQKKYGIHHHLLHACRVEFPQILQEKFQNEFQHLAGKVILAALPAYFDKILQDEFGENNL